MRHTRLLSYPLTILFSFSIILSAALNVSAQNCAPVPSGLVSWWTGDGNANDSSGNANNGALQNGAAFATGKVGQAFSFNGNRQYISIPHSESLNQSQEMTVEGWVRLAELPSNVWGTVITKDNPDSGPYHLLIQQDGSVTWEVLISGWVDINSGPNRISPGEFSHVAGSYNASTGAFCVYVNGIATCAQLSGPMRTNSNAIKIGGDLYNGRFFKGEIDELSIYNRALSASEIQAIFNAGSAGKCKLSATPAQSVQIGPAINLGCVNSSFNTVFYTNTVNFNYAGGTVTLSSTPDGSGTLSTDDEVKIEVTQPNGTTKNFSYVYGYPRNTFAVETLPPQIVTSLFANGLNTVTIKYIDNSDCASSTAYYLTGG